MWKLETHSCSSKWIKNMNAAFCSSQKHESAIITKFHYIGFGEISSNRKDLKRTLNII